MKHRVHWYSYTDVFVLTDGEEVVWQWIDCETNEFHTFSKDEKDKLEDIYKKKTGTVLVGYKGQQ